MRACSGILAILIIICVVSRANAMDVIVGEPTNCAVDPYYITLSNPRCIDSSSGESKQSSSRCSANGDTFQISIEYDGLYDIVGENGKVCVSLVGSLMGARRNLLDDYNIDACDGSIVALGGQNCPEDGNYLYERSFELPAEVTSVGNEWLLSGWSGTVVATLTECNSDTTLGCASFAVSTAMNSSSAAFMSAGTAAKAVGGLLVFGVIVSVGAVIMGLIVRARASSSNNASNYRSMQNDAVTV